MARLCIALAALAALSCKADPTQLLVVVSSDLPPEDIRVVRVTVTDMEDATVMSQRDFDVGPDVTLPFSFGVAPPNDKVHHRVEIVAEALPSASAPAVVVRRARVGFIRHETLLLPLFLGQDCRDVLCSPDQTCDLGRCVDARVDENTLEPVRPGEEIGADGGRVDGGSDASASADGGLDAGFDAGFDAGSPPRAAPLLRSPTNGYAAGSRRRPANLAPTARWEPVEGATYYEVAASVECPTDGFRDCDLSLAPTNRVDASAAPLLEGQIPGLSGGLTVWSVRACNDDGCGPYAEPRYVLAGVGPTDLTGDGYGDIVVGAPDAMMRDGAVALFAGPSLTRHPLRVYGMGTGSGGALAFVGDVDGDAVVDLAVVSLEDTGRFEIFRGGSTDPSRLLQTRLPASHARRPSVAGCDLDGDGYSDVALGLSGTATGEVRIYPGPPTATASLTLEPTESGPQAFGAAVACVGDVDGDGYPDLLVGAPDVSPGRAHLIFGDPTRTFARRLPIDPPSGSGVMSFGRSLTGLGDVDGDGLAEFVIGAASSAGGSLFVYSGSDPAGAPTRIDSRIGSQDFGVALGAGDVNGDGAPDLVVGARSTGGASGRAYVYLGPDFTDRPGPTPPSFRSGMDSFGSTVAVGDVGADGFHDLVVGCPACNSFDGSVAYYAGDMDGTHLRSPDSILAGELGDTGAFGAALATASP